MERGDPASAHPYQVPVTTDDIRCGIRRDPRACAVALAIKRQLGLEAVVTGAAIELDGLPPFSSSFALADWLWDFDENRSVEPIVLELRPEERTALIGDREGEAAVEVVLEMSGASR